ncbi:hypothetical protein Hsero_3814 [Herbaspirillum seropedicae SmR1]|uniref:Uncharacterized protein n=1 Tax=Herbaspirillum seropedicae (strain SmR1) TaxID=757424 RepID=D8IRU9_HERSS|nr:hypothetical protein Hsero_3814 [Herbaspirillum seropedicae SmR1]
MTTCSRLLKYCDKSQAFKVEHTYRGQSDQHEKKPGRSWTPGHQTAAGRLPRPPGCDQQTTFNAATSSRATQ